jgi:hypothetical protein
MASTAANVTGTPEQPVAFVSCDGFIFVCDVDNETYLRTFGWTSLIGAAFTAPIYLLLFF